MENDRNLGPNAHHHDFYTKSTTTQYHLIRTRCPPHQLFIALGHALLGGTPEIIYNRLVNGWCVIADHRYTTFLFSLNGLTFAITAVVPTHDHANGHLCAVWNTAE